MQTDPIFTSSQVLYQIPFETPNLQPLCHFNFLQSSGINQQNLPHFNFAEFFDLPSRNLLNLHLPHNFSQDQNLHQCQTPSLVQDPIFNVLMLSRGKSQGMSQCENRDVSNLTSMPQQSQLFMERQLDFDIQHSQKRTETLHGSQGELSSKKKIEIVYPQTKGSSTKNMTKNMGKLLLKWIWANRQILHKRLQYQDSVWESFINKVKSWKKQNNLTRKYLTSKWHGNDPECRIFRIISAHFYRRQCLPAIVQSHIEDKWIHLKKRNKFLEGTGHPHALDTLN